MEDQPKPPSQMQLAIAAAIEAGGRCKLALARRAAEVGSINPLTMHQQIRLYSFELAALREAVFDIACTGPDGEVDEERREDLATSYYQRVAAFMDQEAERLEHKPIIASSLNGGG